MPVHVHFVPNRASTWKFGTYRIKRKILLFLNGRANVHSVAYKNALAYTFEPENMGLRVSFICIVVGQGNPTRGPE